MNTLEELEQNIDQYIAKRHKKELLRGALLSAISLVCVWICLSILEYWGNFSEITRTAIFYSFIVFAFSVLTLKVLKPFLQLIGFLKPLTKSEAANSIGKSLHDVDDKLLNTLSLKDLNTSVSNELVLASINQRAGVLNQHDFAQLVSLKDLLSLIRFLILPIIVFIALSLLIPSMVIDSSLRLIKYSQSFVPPAPFDFDLNNQSLEAVEGESFSLSVSTVGRSIPSQVYIEFSDRKIRMKKAGPGNFEYTLDRILEPTSFNFSAVGVSSDRFVINVKKTPKILKNIARIIPPKYTGLSPNKSANQNRLSVVEGSTIAWNFETNNAMSTSMIDGDSVFSLTGYQPEFESAFNANRTLLLALESDDGLHDTTRIFIDVIPDRHPQVQAIRRVDSTSPGVVFFSGEISDDYGFNKFLFMVSRASNNSKDEVLSIPIEIGTSNLQSFSFIGNLDTFNLQPDESLEYYFEVFDNDAINGSKSARTTIWKLKMPSRSELKSLNEKASAESKKAIETKLNKLSKANDDLDQLKKDLLQKKKPDWQDKEKLKDLLNERKKLLDELEKKTIKQRQQNEVNSKFNEYSEEILEKQEQIEDLFDELFDEEFKKKYDELNELMEKLNKDQMLDKLEDMKLDNEQLEKELDRTLELFKQLEFEQKLEEIIESTKELAQQQKELKEKTSEKSESKEKLKESQEALEESLDELKKDLDKLNELNEELEDKNTLPDQTELEEKASEEMQKATDALDKKNNKKASESQQEAQDSLEEMQKQMESFQDQQAQEKQSENLDDMRQILENLIDLSHHQERVMQELKVTKAKDPRFVSLAKEQKAIIDDTKVVEDSILALSKRMPQLSSKLNKEIGSVKNNMDIALDNMTNQRPNREKQHLETTLVKQQLSMTSLNNLAILFDSMIQQAQKQANSKLKGSGKCDKPGDGKGGKPSAKSMKKAQEQLNKQLEKLREAMEKGEKPNGKKPGQAPGGGTGGMSKELARMAAQQGAIREQLRKLSESLNKDGNKPGTGLKELEKLMEQTEEDILYQNITQETMRRQQKIMTKLLESEKAEREREKDEKRQSKSSDATFDIPESIWDEYLKTKEKELELYKTLPPNLKPFYQNRVNRYFSQFEQ